MPRAELDAQAIIKTCVEAIAADPNIPRYHFQLGRGYSKAGQFDLAKAQYSLAADGGIWVAKAGLADLYFYGDGMPVDRERGFALNLEAAERGVDYAAYYAGLWYRDGLGVAKDLEKSLLWLRKAHELGDPDASLDIGWAYENGLAVPLDYVEAMRWYQLAAKNGNAMAANNIGVFYALGRGGIPKDSVKALVWYRKSQAMGNPLAYINVASFTDRGTATDKNPALAATYVMQAFELGDSWSDPFNRDVVFKDKWSPEFWREIQGHLAKLGHYDGPIDGQFTQATQDAFEKIVDK